MTDRTFQLCFAVEPSPAHPDHETHGEAFAVCWLVKPDLQAAEAATLAALSEDHWNVLDKEYGKAVRREDFADDDDLLEYFEQAQGGQEVFLFHMSPRFPVYRVTARVRKGTDEGEAHYLVSGASLMANEDELFDPAFWTESRARDALKTARRLIDEAEWETAAITTSGPVSFADVEDDLKPYYGAAEDDGECMVFVLAGSAGGSTDEPSS